MEIDPAQYTNEFGYVHDLKMLIVHTEIWFTSFMGVFALVFFASLAIYCCKYRNQKDEAAVYHQTNTNDI